MSARLESPLPVCPECEEVIDRPYALIGDFYVHIDCITWEESHTTIDERFPIDRKAALRGFCD